MLYIFSKFILSTKIYVLQKYVKGESFSSNKIVQIFSSKIFDNQHSFSFINFPHTLLFWNVIIFIQKVDTFRLFFWILFQSGGLIFLSIHIERQCCNENVFLKGEVTLPKLNSHLQCYEIYYIHNNKSREINWNIRGKYVSLSAKRNTRICLCPLLKICANRFPFVKIPKKSQFLKSFTWECTLNWHEDF